ncbi:low affinity immunoglobulin epsilon Fc receptor-like [Asterias rubens]|uniref:low affinity immunoglobulin epsilon Fc receptor-like n=1 Tax=Asterias rubens TaxID=7604 RepID=UPI001455B000|nr:low affinity immunoglobulin epsilon Fc receptor-like [Asterias rubens]
MNWYQAKHTCGESRANLVIPNSQSEQNYIWELILNKFNQTPATDLWIGCNDIEEEGNWQHCPLKGEINAYENWANMEPNNDGGADCGALRVSRRGQWDDQQCTHYVNYALCEIPAINTPVSSPLMNNPRRLTPQCLLHYAMEGLLGNGKGTVLCRSHTRCHSFILTENDGRNSVCRTSNKPN